MGKKNDGPLCPLLGKGCIEHECAWYCQVQGAHPQTGETVSQWACAVAWVPLLVIDQTQQVRHQAAAAEQARNALLTLRTAADLRSIGEDDAPQLIAQ